MNITFGTFLFAAGLGSGLLFAATEPVLLIGSGIAVFFGIIDMTVNQRPKKKDKIKFIT